MAVTVLRLDGFEHGQLTGPGGYSNISNATISTTTVRSGARSLRFNATAAAASARLQGLLTGQRRFALAFYVRFATLPDADWAIFSAGGSLGGSFGWDVTSGKFCFKVGGTDTVMGSVVATGQWYRIVWELDQTADPAVARVTIDNDVANEATLNTTPITPADLTDFFWGQAATNRTLDCFIDDAVWSVTDADYEQFRDDWTDQAIESIIPSSDGTHNITTSGDFDSFTGTAFSNSTTNGNTFIGHRPMQFANTADQVIRQELGTTANYMEFGMENHTLSGTPIAAKAMTARVDSASAGANSAEMRLLLSDDTEVLTTGSISAWNSTEDPSNVVSARTRMCIDPSGGWDNTKIDGLKARVGFGDNAPDANFIDFMVEFLYATPAAGATPLVIQDAAHAHAADNLALTQHNVLAIQDAAHGHTADNQVLTQHNILAIQDASHGHSADNLVLTQHNVLAVQDALHAHAADNVVLTAHDPSGATLVIQDALHAHAADNVVLAQHNILVIADATHGHAADNLALVQHNVLAIQDARHVHMADHIDDIGGDPVGQLDNDVVRMRRARQPIGT